MRISKQEMVLRQYKDAEYEAMARDFRPNPEALARRAKEQEVDRQYEIAVRFRKRLQATVGRFENRNRQQLVMPPVGREPKWTPYTSEPDWYTPMYPEIYSFEEMQQDHKRGHLKFPAREQRPVTGCPNCKSAIYRRHRRREMKRDVVSWLEGKCYLCDDRDVLDYAFHIIRLWGGPSSIGRRLHHSANDLEGEVRDNYVLLCPACYQEKGRKAVYEKIRKQHPGLAHPPPRQGRHPKV